MCNQTNIRSFWEQIRKLLAVALMSALLITGGCGQSSGPNDNSSPAVASAPQDATIQVHPVKLALISDQTLSMNWARTSPLTIHDLESLRNLYHSCGGEIIFGLIRDQSNRGLIRTRFPVLPPAPQKPQTQDDMFKDAESEDTYQQQLIKWKESCDKRRLNVDHLFDEFLVAIKPLLEQKANAQKSDIWSAVGRADLALSESDASWPLPTRRYLLLISDGLDTVGKPSTPLQSGAKVTLVNGSTSLGSLTSLNPMRFESIKAAIQEIVAIEGEK